MNYYTGRACDLRVALASPTFGIATPNWSLGFKRSVYAVESIPAMHVYSGQGFDLPTRPHFSGGQLQKKKKKKKKHNVRCKQARRTGQALFSSLCPVYRASLYHVCMSDGCYDGMLIFCCAVLKHQDRTHICLCASALEEEMPWIVSDYTYSLITWLAGAVT